MLSEKAFGRMFLTDYRQFEFEVTHSERSCRKLLRSDFIIALQDLNHGSDNWRTACTCWNYYFETKEAISNSTGLVRGLFGESAMALDTVRKYTVGQKNGKAEIRWRFGAALSAQKRALTRLTDKQQDRLEWNISSCGVYCL